MNYTFKPTAEAVWAVLTAVALIVLQAVIAQPTPPTDIKAWLVALGGACLRAAVGAAIALFTKEAVQKSKRRKRI